MNIFIAAGSIREALEVAHDFNLKSAWTMLGNYNEDHEHLHGLRNPVILVGSGFRSRQGADDLWPALFARVYAKQWKQA